MREDLIRKAIELLERALAESPTESHASSRSNGKIDDLNSPAAWLRLYRFLRLIEIEGEDGIDVDRQREIAIEVGYDPRATGGFFGGHNASLRRDPQSDRRYLTEEGKRLLRRGRAEFGDQVDP